MPQVYVSKREKALKDAMKNRDVEALFWWIVDEHKVSLLSGDKSHLNPGLFRLALDHLSRLHLKRGNDLDEAAGSAASELEQALRLVK